MLLWNKNYLQTEYRPKAFPAQVSLTIIIDWEPNITTFNDMNTINHKWELKLENSINSFGQKGIFHW